MGKVRRNSSLVLNFEMLVRGDRFAVVRDRETYEDTVRGEHVPEDLCE